MSTKYERIRESVRDFVNQNLLVGEEYSMKYEEFERGYEEFLDENNICINNEKNPVSITGELIRQHPSITRGRRDYGRILIGIGPRELKGKTVTDFVRQRIVSDKSSRISNEEIREAVKDFMGDTGRSLPHLREVTGTIIRKCEGAERVMYYEGRAMRGLSGVGLKQEVRE